MIHKLLLGLLATCLVVQAYTSRDGTTVTMCQENQPCTCYKAGPKLDCRGQLESWRYKSSSTKFVTPSENFYPIEIDVSNNKLNHFFTFNFLTEEQRRHVEILNLANNNLYRPQNFNLSAFENLRVLNLSNVGIASYKDYNTGRYESQDWTGIWSFSDIFDTLEVLDLSNNDITVFPSELFFKFKKLKTVILDNNRIVNLGPYGYESNTIEELSMNHCQLKYYQLEDILRTVPSVKKLSVRNNNFGSFPSQIFRSLKNLEFLDLSYNNIDTNSWDDPIMGTSYSTKTILLSNNDFYRIGPNFFEKFPNLTTLDLSHNWRLRTLHPNAFGVRYSHDKRGLSELNLEGTSIETLDKDMMDWSKLTSLKINDTHLTCDTDLSWLILNKSIPIDKDVKCYSPLALKGRRLRDVKNEELQNPVETSIMYYVKQALDWLTQDPTLFYFGLGVLSSCAVVFALKCCYCTLCCCVRRTDQKLMKLKEKHDRQQLLESANSKPQEEDTETIVSTIPDN